MNESFLTFETIPDEILLGIFKYLNTIDIFRSFYNLNFRLNTLIQSLNNLHLFISEESPCYDILHIYPYIYSLATSGEVNINLHQFKNLHRLVLYHPSDSLLEQLNVTYLPELEHLSIPDILFGMSSINQKIFSNRFPNLKFCNLFGCETIETILKWTQTYSLYTLKIGYVDFHVYKAILSSCPNLYHLSLKMFQSYLKLSHICIHLHLKKLEISSEINDWHYNDQLIDNFLQCVPNLEQLSITRSISSSNIIDLIPDYDWLSSMISIRLPILRYFNFCLHLEYHLEFFEFVGTETRRHLRKSFMNAHKSRYQTRFILK